MAYSTKVRYTSNNSIPEFTETVSLTSMGPSSNINNSNLKFYEYEAGEVIDIILDPTHPEYKDSTDIGKAKIRLLHSQRNVEEDKLMWVKPNFSFGLKTYPLLHEIVLTAYYISSAGNISTISDSLNSLKILYYFDILNALGRINNNAMMDISISKGLKKKSNESGQINLYADNKLRTKNKNLVLGNKFKDNPNIKPLFADEGDILYEGRSGQSIHYLLTSDQKPIIIIDSTSKYTDKNNSQRIEDINKDDSIILISSNTTDDIPLILASQNTKAYPGTYPKKITGSNIIFSSANIILNAKEKDINLISKNVINLSGKYFSAHVNKKINLITNSEFNIEADKNVDISTAKNVNLSADKNINLSAQKILLGGNSAKQPVVLGHELKSWLNRLISALTKLTVTCTAPGSPSSPPINTAEFITLQTQLMTILSNSVKTK